MLSTTVAELQLALKSLQEDVHETRSAIRALHEEFREVQQAIETLQDNIEMMRAQPPGLVTQTDDIKVQLQNLTAMLQQLQLSNNSAQMPRAAGNHQLAVVPVGPASSSTDYNQGSSWANWQNWDDRQGGGFQQWQDWDQEEIKEIPFPRPSWITVPGPCLYANKECEEGTMAEYHVYYKSRGHRKNEILCNACVISHRDELSGIMKIRFQ